MLGGLGEGCRSFKRVNRFGTCFGSDAMVKTAVPAKVEGPEFVRPSHIGTPGFPGPTWSRSCSTSVGSGGSGTDGHSGESAQ